jgi:hypothetical protein
MSMQSGVAAQFTTLDDSDPKIGKETPGTSTKAAHGDHIHQIPIVIGVFVDGGKPQLESTSTLCYIWIPTNGGLYWDDSLELLYIG